MASRIFKSSLTRYGTGRELARRTPTCSLQFRSITNSVRPEYVSSVRKVERGAPQPGGWMPSLMHSSGEVKFTVIRIPPSKQVPPHLHSKAWDYFLPLSGQGRISVYGADGQEHHYEMRKDTFLAVPPGDGHVVRNKMDSEDFVFLIAQAPRSAYDFVPQQDLVDKIGGETSQM